MIHWKCTDCGTTNRPGAIECVVCVNKKCNHIGPQRDRNGIPETLKCNCNGKTTEIWHAVHECEVHGRCLPTFKGPFDEDHQMEAKLYHLCHGCEQRELASA